MTSNTPFEAGDVIYVTGRHARRFIENWLKLQPASAGAHDLHPLPRRRVWDRFEYLELDNAKAANRSRVLLVQHAAGDHRITGARAELVTISATEADVIRLDGREVWNLRLSLKGAAPAMVEAGR